MASSLSLDMGYLFFFFFLVDSRVLLLMVVQLVDILVLSQEEMSAHISNSPS